MTASFQMPGSNELMFSQTEFDSLEKGLLKLNTPRDVLEAVAGWLFNEFDPSFVCFYADDGAKTNHVKYFRLNKEGPFAVEPFVAERNACGEAENAIYVGPSGCVSLPFGFSSSIQGLIFIGRCTGSESGQYPRALLKKLNPVSRILNKTLLFFEAERLHEEKNRLQYAFSRYVSPDVVRNIVENKATVQISGEKRCLSVIFTDLRGFTTISENMDSVALVRVLNMYLNEMTQVILSLGGTIDKFEGDAIMAFFGAPNKMEDHAIRCCLAALRMKKMEMLLNEQLLREKLVTIPFFTRIGINTGDMVVGNVGSLQRLDYTVIGNNVNIASRIENANKRYNTSILISGSTFRLVAGAFKCQYADTVYLKGVHEPVALYELLSEYPGAIPDYSNYVTGVTNGQDKNASELEEI